MREKADEFLTELKIVQIEYYVYLFGIYIFIRLMKGLKNGSKEVKGGRCLRGSDEKL